MTDNPTPVERGQIDELFADLDPELAEVLDEVARLSVRLVVHRVGGGGDRFLSPRAAGSCRTKARFAPRQPQQS